MPEQSLPASVAKVNKNYGSAKLFGIKLQRNRTFLKKEKPNFCKKERNYLEVLVIFPKQVTPLTPLTPKHLGGQVNTSRKRMLSGVRGARGVG